MSRDIDTIATHRARQQVSSVRYVENEHDIQMTKMQAEKYYMKKEHKEEIRSLRNEINDEWKE